jgi:branched-chain amino acid transport system permease protein
MDRMPATALDRLPPWLLPALAGAALLLVQPLLTPYLQDLVLRIVVLAVFALSLELLIGTTGLVSLGHAAFYGIGAYATVMLSPADGPGSIALLLPAAAGCAALYALFVGAFSLRTKGVYFIMVTLAFAQMAYFVFHDTKFGGGTDGIYLNFPPVLGDAVKPLLDSGDKTTLYRLASATLIATYALLALLRRSRFGHALAGIRVNEQRMRAAGFPTTLYKLAAFVIGGALAGVAGFLVAAKDGVVNPELLSWHVSGEVMLVIILGGLGHLRGAVIGAVAFVVLKEALSNPALVGRVAEHWQLTLGFTVIVFVALLPKGLIGVLQRSKA